MPFMTTIFFETKMITRSQIMRLGIPMHTKTFTLNRTNKTLCPPSVCLGRRLPGTKNAWEITNVNVRFDFELKN